jgi:hypothetical protein
VTIGVNPRFPRNPAPGHKPPRTPLFRLSNFGLFC